MAIHKLTPGKLAKIIKGGTNGMYGDGNNLWLQITNDGAGKSWVFRWTDRKTKQGRNMGLGPVSRYTIHEARDMAVANLKLLDNGKDPIEERKAKLNTEKIEAGLAKTVQEVQDEFYDAQIKHLGQHARKSFLGTIGRYVLPRIGGMPIARVTQSVFLDGKPIIPPKNRWRPVVTPTAPEDKNRVGFRELWAGDTHRRFSTAEQILSFMQRMIDFAINRKYCDGPNPLSWEFLKHELPDRKRVHTPQHHPPLPYKDAPRFMHDLRAYQDRSVRATGHPTRALWVEFLTLTGVRLSEARLGTWAEMEDLDGRYPVWKAVHHKNRHITGKPHFVPITKPMLDVLEEMARRYPNHKPTDLVFPSPYDGHDPRSKRRGGNRPFDGGSANTFIQNAMKWPAHITAHGFRQTFINWARSVGMTKELYDIQVGHVPRGKVDQAYETDQLVEVRRPWLEDWGNYCSLPPAGAEVVKTTGAKVLKIMPKNRRRSAS